MIHSSFNNKLVCKPDREIVMYKKRPVSKPVLIHYASRKCIEQEIRKIQSDIDHMFDSLTQGSPSLNVDMECHIDTKTNTLICK